MEDDDDISFWYMLIVKWNSKSQFILYQMVVISDKYGYKLNPPNFSSVSSKEFHEKKKMRWHTDMISP